jgi:hypothetical protein
MSKIIRTLSGTKTVNVAGPAGGGGIVLQPQAPVVDCPGCPAGGDCVADNAVPQWVADSNGLYFAGTTIAFDEAAYVGVPPPVYGGLFDLSGAVADRAIVCCNVEWNIAINTGGDVGDFGYKVVGGLIIVEYGWLEAGTMRMVATPTICGEALPPLVYDWANPQ